MSRKLVVLSIFAAGVCGLLFLSQNFSAPTAHAQSKQRGANWEAADCATFKITGAPAGVECGYVNSPLRHANPTGAEIKLATVIIPADAAEKRPDPLFIGQGGPGGSTIGTYAAAFITSAAMRPVRNREIVLWDQRGTLFSKPSLFCPEVHEMEMKAAAGEITTDPGIAHFQACGDRLKKEVGDLSAFNSDENADDIEVIRQTLGYDKINYYGVSYGTELGQFLMRRHPQIVRTATLDGVVPLTYNLYSEPAFAKQRIGEKYIHACAADAKCNAAFPNLGQRYNALIDKLNANPPTLDVSAPDNPDKKARVKLTGNQLESVLFQALYMDVHETIPLIIDRTDKGDYTLVSSLLLPLTMFSENVATGMYMAVTCAERGDTDPQTADFSKISPRIAEEERKSAATEVEVCKNWGIQLVPRTDIAALKSDIPTLLLSGDFDPITPPPYAEQLKQTLPNSRHVVFPLGSHGQVPGACGNQLLANFVENPTANLDTSCAVGDVKFKTEADLVLVPSLRNALRDYGGGGGQMLFVAENAPAIVLSLLMLMAIPIYAIGWLIHRKRHPVSETNGKNDWTATLSKFAPWLAVAAGLVFLFFQISLGAAVLATQQTNMVTFFLGALSGGWRWIFWLSSLGVLLVVGMLVANVALWKGHHRSIIGRLYYALLTLFGVGIVIALGYLGLIGV